MKSKRLNTAASGWLQRMVRRFRVANALNVALAMQNKTLRKVTMEVPPSRCGLDSVAGDRGPEAWEWAPKSRSKPTKGNYDVAPLAQSRMKRRSAAPRVGR